MVIVVGNGHGDTSSNLGRDCSSSRLHSTGGLDNHKKWQTLVYKKYNIFYFSSLLQVWSLRERERERERER